MAHNVLLHDEIYGLLAEFASGERLLEAARRAREAGYRRIDAYSPLPVAGLAEALGFARTRVPMVTLFGGILGGVVGYVMQWYLMVVDYPMNIGGRPLHSWPAFVPITFEMTILFAAFFAVLGMLGLNRLPMPYHPLFHVDRFTLATQDRFFLCIEATDPQFDIGRTGEFLRTLGPAAVMVVPL